MRLYSHCRAAAVLTLALAAPAAAQSVHGRLVDPSGRAVEQVLVALVDATGRQRAGALTGAGGEFQIRAPGAGRYSLRAERVGYATVTSPAFELRDGETREQRLVAAGRPVTLQALVVTPRSRRCAVRPGAGVATATLWEEARKALAAAEFATHSGVFYYDVVRWERDLALGSGSVLHDERRSSGGVSVVPFVSIPPGELSRLGFIQKTKGDSVIYAAPDAGVLLSDQFLDDHCFRVATGAADSALIGLEFEPVRGRMLPDVRGVLWLDRATAELRRVEYRYVNGPPESRNPQVGGSVEFERLRGGPWIVKRWAIRMPMAELMRGGLTPDGIRMGQQTPRMTAVREAGGEVTAARVLNGAASGAPIVAAGGAAAAIEGVAWDSTTRRPLAGARVFLSGTGTEAVTGRDGRYRLEAPAPGTYTVALGAPELGPIAQTVRPREVTAVAGQTARADLAVPAFPRVAAQLCPEASLRTFHGIVVGRVQGLGPDTVAVRATWQHVTLNSAMLGATSNFTESRPDANGFYLLCGVPEGADVEVAVRPARQTIRAAAPSDPRNQTLRSPGREISRVEVSVAPGVPLRLDVGSDAAPRGENPGRRPE